MNDLMKSIREAAEGIKKEASAVSPAVEKKVEVLLDPVMKAAQDIMNEMEKAASEECDVILSDKAVHSLGLDKAEVKTEEEKKEEEKKEEEKKDEEKTASEIELAEGYLKHAFAMQKEASEAYAEAEILKAAALRVLYQNGHFTEEDVQKVASLTFDDVFEK